MFISHYDVTADYPDRINRALFIMGLGLINEAWEMPFHAHLKSQLIYVDSGVITLETEDSLWNVPFQGAVWIPSNIIHRAKISGNAKGFVLFIDPAFVPDLPKTCCTMAISPLVRELLQKASTFPEHYDESGREGRLVAVLLEELISSPVAQMNLSMPKNPRLRKMVDLMFEAPSQKRTLEDWAKLVNMSERSLSRTFLKETGLSVNRWRRQMHIMKALSLLAEEVSIQEIADMLGYENSSAFITMFRKAMGQTPRRFMQEHKEGHQPSLHIPIGSFYEY